MVDIDPAELGKLKPYTTLSICADAGDFIREFLAQRESIRPKDRSPWMERCKDWKAKYPIVQPEHRQPDQAVSTYYLAEILSQELKENEMIVSGSSGAGRRETVCVDGDGGLQMNIQEYATVQRLNLPIKFFILNNDGYSSIRTSQQRWFGRLTGADATSGMTLPDIGKVAAAYGLQTVRIEDQRDLRAQVRAVLDMPGPVVCDVVSLPEEARMPSLASAQRKDGSMYSKPLEDLWPFLGREEFLENMIIAPVEE